MIEALCDNIDGSVTLISYFCIQSLNLTLSKDSGKEALNFDDFAANIDNSTKSLIENCSFFKYSKSDVIVETAILVLGLLSYVHSQQAYSSIVKQIEKVFENFISEIINHQSELVQCRYALFLGYLIDLLYKDHPYAFKETVLFLYRSVDLQGDKKAIAL